MEYSLEDNKKERLEMGLTHMCTVGSSPRRRGDKGRCERARGHLRGGLVFSYRAPQYGDIHHLSQGSNLQL